VYMCDEHTFHGMVDPSQCMMLEEPGPECEVCQAARSTEAPITYLDAHRPGWVHWWAICLACGADKILSVHHEDTKPPLQCPRCKQMTLARTAPAE
jgi:hypothetical protein